jgi:hypothetical protein
VIEEERNRTKLKHNGKHAVQKATKKAKDKQEPQMRLLVRESKLFYATGSAGASDLPVDGATAVVFAPAAVAVADPAGAARALLASFDSSIASGEEEAAGSGGGEGEALAGRGTGGTAAPAAAEAAAAAAAAAAAMLLAFVVGVAAPVNGWVAPAAGCAAIIAANCCACAGLVMPLFIAICM